MCEQEKTMQNRNKLTLTQQILGEVSNMQQVSMLGMQKLGEMQSKQVMAMYVIEIHLARFNQEQESIGLGQWMQCNGYCKNAKDNNAKQIY